MNWIIGGFVLYIMARAGNDPEKRRREQEAFERNWTASTQAGLAEMLAEEAGETHWCHSGD